MEDPDQLTPEPESDDVSGDRHQAKHPVIVFHPILKTVFLVLAWVSLGLYLEITGPTLQDLKWRLNASYEKVARAVATREGGFLSGAILGGLLVDKFTGCCNLIIAMSLCGAALATAVVPWAPTTEILGFLCFVRGFFEGLINIAGNKLILIIWKEKAASPLHVLHLGYGVGSFLVPLIANPFLAVHIQKENNASFSNDSDSPMTKPDATSGAKSAVNATLTEINTKAEPAQLIHAIAESNIEYPYGIVAGVITCVSIAFFVYQFRDPSQGVKESDTKPKTNTICANVELALRGKCAMNGDNESTVKEKTVASHSTANQTILQKCKSLTQSMNPATCAGGKLTYGLHIFTFLFLHFFNTVGGARLFGKFVRAFSVDQLQFSKDEGSYINTSYWVSHCVGRFAVFIAARYIAIRTLLLIEVTGVFITVTLLNIFAYKDSLAFWILTQPMGMFMSPLFPTGLALGHYHLDMTGLAITFCILGGSLGGVAYMWIIGHTYDKYGPRSFLYLLAAYGTAMCICAYIFHFTSANQLSASDRRDDCKESSEISDSKVAEHLPPPTTDREPLECGMQAREFRIPSIVITDTSAQ